MASNRKLQSEMDRVLKQITEHMTEFDNIWEKVHTAPTPNLKEKYESDLKKEIKKLQRFRDQIKSWASNPDIKNKKPLLDARKAIETEMERFKVLEKETKTKAYSKEGLNASLRKPNQLDPREDPEKRDTFLWLDEIEEKLQQQMEEFEAKLESIKSASATSSKKGKKGSSSSQTAEEDTQHFIDRHAHHLEQIGRIKDRLESGELEASQVEEIKEDIEYYVNCNQDPDFQEDESLYESIGQDEEEGEQTSDKESGENKDEDEDEEKNENDAEDDGDNDVTNDAEDEDTTEDDKKAYSSSKVSPDKNNSSKSNTSSTATTATSSSTTAQNNKGKTSTTSTTTTTTTPTPVPAPTPINPSSVQAGKVESLASILAKQQKATTQPAGPTAAAVVAASSAKAASTSASTSTGNNTSPNSRNTAPSPTSTPQLGPTVAPGLKQPVPGAPTAAAIVAQSQQRPSGTNTPPLGMNGQPTAASIVANAAARTPAPGLNAPNASNTRGNMTAPPGLQPSATPPPGLGMGNLANMDPNNPSSMGLSSHVHANTPPLPLNNGPATSSLAYKERDRSSLPDDYLANLACLDASLKNIPDPSDSERPKTYVPRNPYRTPNFFPSMPATIFDEAVHAHAAQQQAADGTVQPPASIYEKLSIDTLFFIFYFQQGTHHQYLAARELKRQSWRYHKNFLTWFQRHDEPKYTSDEQEQGTYVYFDYDSGWTLRLKADFTFEYRHLEDELSVPVSSSFQNN